MKTSRIFISLVVGSIILTSCDRKGAEILINNSGNDVINDYMVEIPCSGNAKYSLPFDIIDINGEKVGYQICADSTVIFLTTVKPHETVRYRIEPSDIDSINTPKTFVFGCKYPERCDDLSWENDLVGFRIYGPGTQAKDEKAYGYDLFFKYPDSGLIVEKLYEPETSPATWAKVDSLRKISDTLADEYISSFSYHIDHGLGMDCYPVGPTLGAGVCAPIDSTGNIIFPWCYSTADIIENGPLRFTVHLKFNPMVVDNMGIIEHRIISLDAASHLNTTKVWYENQTKPIDYIIGVPRRDDSNAIIDSITGYVAYADPTDHRPGNIAMLGLVFENSMRSYGEIKGHIGAIGTVAPGDTVTYRWGFTWPKSDITTMTKWGNYLRYIADTDIKKNINITIK